LPFHDLAEAIAVAPDGATLTLHGTERFRLRPLSWAGKALTLRAAPGARPCLERGDQGARTWEALLSTDRALVLEGLELHAPETVEPWPLVCVEGATLHMKDCSLSSAGRSGGPLVVLRCGAEVGLRGCQFDAPEQALSVQVGQRPCRVALERCIVRARAPEGTALSLWASEEHDPATLEVNLERCELSAGRAIACRSLRAPARFTARDNEFTFRSALFSFDGYANKEGPRSTTRAGHDNRYRALGPWLRLDGEPAAGAFRFER
jgi:hypothetical protein